MTASEVVTMPMEGEGPLQRSLGKSHSPPLLARAETLLVLALALVSAVALVGMTAAILGVFRPLLVLPLSAALWAELYLLWDPGLRVARSSRSASSKWWIAVAVLIVAMTVWNARLAAEHSLGDRDPGIYLNTAAWLASEGSLIFEPSLGALGSSDQIVKGGPGLYPAGEPGTYHFQFQHLLPVLQAAGGWLGGDFVLTRVPALLAGLALFAFFALANTLLRPWLSAVATAALGLNLAFVYTARDSYSEPLMLALLAGGLWLLLNAIDVQSARRAAFAGVVFGTAALTRVDFSVYLIGLIVFLAIETIRARDGGRAVFWSRKALPAFGLGLAPGFMLGAADGFLRSRGYIEAQLHILLPLFGLVATTAIGAALIVLIWPRLRSLRTFIRRRQSQLALVAGLGVVSISIFALVIRPVALVEHDPGLMGTRHATYEAIQRAEGVQVDPDRTYYERSMWWLSWYVGFPVLVAAVVALSLAAARVVRGVAGRPEALLFLVVITPLILTLARPSAFPDHPWVMRRFVPLAIPGVVMFSGLLAERVLASSRPGWTRRVGRIGAAALAVAMVALPLRALAPVGSYHAYADFVDPIRTACQRVGPRGAVVVLPPISGTLSLAFQSLCQIPAVGVRGQLSSEEARRLAAEFREQNRRLWLVGASGESLTLSGGLPILRLHSAVGTRLRPTLTHRPDQLLPHEASFVIGEVGNAAAPSGFYGPEHESDAAPWRWLASDPWLTLVSEGPTWIAFRAVSYGRSREVTFRSLSGEMLSADVGTRPRTILLGPFDVHSREELEIETRPGAATGPAGDSRPLSVSITDPQVVNQPIAALGTTGFWPSEQDPSGRSFNWIKPRATVQIVASPETATARLTFTASAPRGPLTLTVRSAGEDLANLQIRPGFRRYAVENVPLSHGRAVVDLLHSPTPDVVQGNDPRKLAVMASEFEASR